MDDTMMFVDVTLVKIDMHVHTRACTCTHRCMHAHTYEQTHTHTAMWGYAILTYIYFHKVRAYMVCLSFIPCGREYICYG